jgi:hypothetical protein
MEQDVAAFGGSTTTPEPAFRKRPPPIRANFCSPWNCEPLFCIWEKLDVSPSLSREATRPNWAFFGINNRRIPQNDGRQAAHECEGC